MGVDSRQQFDNNQTMSTSSNVPTLTTRQFELVAKALSDSRRMALLEAISSAKEYPCHRLCDEFPVSKGTISHHMKELLRAGLIRARRDGQFLHYEVCRDTIEAYTNELGRRLG
jgi:ArsR family transcriptional regulator, arsenate/arsenite/antimonite-responsive transcriptional repressor